MARSTITEDVTTQVDGIKTSFNIVGGPYIAGSLVVEHDGMRLRSGVGLDFEEVPTFDGFTMCFVPRAGDGLQVQFEIDDIVAGGALVVASGIDPSTC